jgi:hypothetical protein
MTPLQFCIEVFLVSVVAGVLGSIFGLGGGTIVVPALTLAFGLDIRYAIGASVVSIIATSSGAAAAYVKERLTNLRVAMLLELGTTTGAITGAYLAGLIQTRWLFVIFGLMMGYSAIRMLKNPEKHGPDAVPPDALSDRLRLHGSYFDHSLNREIVYRVTRAKTGLALMFGAGVVSGLLGIGSGALKVPAMDLAMRLPIKVSTATSNFMIGVTGAATAGVYFCRGDIDPFVAAPVAAGVLAGALIGSRVLPRLQNESIRRAFVVVLLWVSAQMFFKGVMA